MNVLDALLTVSPTVVLVSLVAVPTVRCLALLIGFVIAVRKSAGPDRVAAFSDLARALTPARRVPAANPDQGAAP